LSDDAPGFLLTSATRKPDLLFHTAKKLRRLLMVLLRSNDFEVVIVSDVYSIRCLTQ